MIVNSVEHRHAGNGWAVVAMYPDECASIAYIGKGVVGTQFFSVWTKKLTPESRPIAPDLLTKIEQIRDDLAIGKSIIKDTRLVRV